MACSLGAAVPPFAPHAISVSLPTWQDNVDYEEGEKRVVDAMVSGYPRFFIHLGIQKLARQCRQKFGSSGEDCMLFPSRKIAENCRSFMIDRAHAQGIDIPIRLVQHVIHPNNGSSNSPSIELHIVLFPENQFSLAKQFWQHTGLGVSSRLAERCLIMLQDQEQLPTSMASPRIPGKSGNKHYSAKPPRESQVENAVDDLEDATYLEERYGRNLPQDAAASAKRAMKRRIAGVLVRDSPSDWSQAGKQDAEVGPSTRGVHEVSEDDVYLYPTGMAAIWNAHQLALHVRPPTKSICFGFPYTDTLKILEKWGPGCDFLGNGLDKDIDELEQILERESAQRPGQPPILALFTEFPSNPLLRCANLPRLRALADKYDFLIVVDDTIGNLVNVEVLPYSDIVVSSLSKIFSGDANVMGGSLVLNPRGKHYASLKQHITNNFEDTYFNEDAIYMERNSRDFARRIRAIDENTEVVCDFLRSHSLASSSPPENTVIKEVFYPKYTTTEHYNKCKVSEDAGFGGLFSLTFVTAEAARAFFDALPCYKGPSLGSNFTLACPYTILAHYMERDWAAKYGIEEGLVRVSVGMEDRQTLLEDFGKALAAAQATSTSSTSYVV
ncbi:hypothetical protein QCA50_001011 [Cerrena zonata]|uniref:cystathionine gamma-synthase n=1 Tax=Cerrena zonata TaxID=2478898 RepID=A0AAW0GZW2_9APHY